MIRWRELRQRQIGTGARPPGPSCLDVLSFPTAFFPERVGAYGLGGLWLAGLAAVVPLLAPVKKDAARRGAVFRREIWMCWPLEKSTCGGVSVVQIVFYLHFVLPLLELYGVPLFGLSFVLLSHCLLFSCYQSSTCHGMPPYLLCLIRRTSTQVLVVYLTPTPYSVQVFACRLSSLFRPILVARRAGIPVSSDVSLCWVGLRPCSSPAVLLPSTLASSGHALA